MKIHIVQKGDTLWKLAEQYSVDFEVLKQANQHLSDPDQLSPGMKIKIPTSTGTKKEAPKKGAPKKEIPKKEIPVTPPKKEAPKPLKVEKAKEEPDYEQLKKLLKVAAPYVLKKLLKEEQPQLLQEIKIEIEMDQKQEIEQMYKKPLVSEPKYVPQMPAPPKQMPMQEMKFHMPPPPAPKKKEMPPHAPFSPYQAPYKGPKDSYYAPTHGYGGTHGCGCGPYAHETYAHGVQGTSAYKDGVPMMPQYGNMPYQGNTHYQQPMAHQPMMPMGYGLPSHVPKHEYHVPQYEHHAPQYGYHASDQKPCHLPSQMKREELDSRAENE